MVTLCTSDPVYNLVDTPFWFLYNEIAEIKFRNLIFWEGTMFRERGVWGAILLSLSFLFVLACGISITPDTSSPPAFDPTKAALDLQATSIALQLTHAALIAQQAVQPTSPPPQPTIAQPEAPAQVQSTPTQDVEARIRAANVLV